MIRWLLKVIGIFVGCMIIAWVALALLIGLAMSHVSTKDIATVSFPEESVTLKLWSECDGDMVSNWAYASVQDGPTNIIPRVHVTSSGWTGQGVRRQYTTEDRRFFVIHWQVKGWKDQLLIYDRDLKDVLTIEHGKQKQYWRSSSHNRSDEYWHHWYSVIRTQFPSLPDLQWHRPTLALQRIEANASGQQTNGR